VREFTTGQDKGKWWRRWWGKIKKALGI